MILFAKRWLKPITRNSCLNSDHWDKNKIRIRKHKLDEDAVHLPQDHYDCYKNEVEYGAKRDKAKDDLEKAKDKVDLEIRSMKVDEINISFDLQLTEYPKEAGIKALINLSGEVKDAQAEFLKYKKIANRWAARRKSLERKYGMLELLSYLYTSGYWMKTSHDGRKEVPAPARKIERNLSKRISRETSGLRRLSKEVFDT